MSVQLCATGRIITHMSFYSENVNCCSRTSSLKCHAGSLSYITIYQTLLCLNLKIYIYIYIVVLVVRCVSEHSFIQFVLALLCYIVREKKMFS